MASLFAGGDVPPLIIDVIRAGNGGVRGIVVGEVIRRLVARTVAQQLGLAVEAAISPFQFALSTKSGCECVAHCIQALCETDPQLTFTSVDGVSAFDLISRRAMMAGLEWMVVPPCCLLCTSSTGDPRLTGGRTILAQCTQSTRAKEGRRGIR